MSKEPLGRFDLCLNVKDVKKSAEFYQKMGLEKVKGLYKFSRRGLYCKFSSFFLNLTNQLRIVYNRL